MVVQTLLFIREVWFVALGIIFVKNENINLTTMHSIVYF